MMDWGYQDGGGWLMGLAMLLGVLVLAAALGLAFVAYGRHTQTGPQDGPQVRPVTEEPERALTMRFARGEIDAETLASARAVLRQH